MAVKASAYSEPRGSLCSTRCQPSAAESCSPAAAPSRRSPPFAYTPSADSGPEQSRHSVHVTECRDCSGAGTDDLQAHGGSLVLCAAQTFLVIEDSKEVVGRRRRHQADRRRCRPQGQRSPLWPQRAAAWPLVPRSARTNAPRSGPLFLDSTICNAYV